MEKHIPKLGLETRKYTKLVHLYHIENKEPYTIFAQAV